MKYRTVIMSDLHLGSKSCRADDILKFLNKLECKTLILNGDIIDGWALKRGSKWIDKHTKVVRKLLKMAEKGTQIIWIRGNHDDFLDEHLGTIIGNIRITDELIYRGLNQKSYYIVHGDKLDVFSSKFKLIAKIGSIGYDLALWLNRWYNKYREWRNLPYYSISKKIKDSVKSAVSFVADFENNAIKLSKSKKCDFIICGHIHKPIIINGYMNSGDWCENSSALVENDKGVWTIVYCNV